MLAKSSHRTERQEEANVRERRLCTELEILTNQGEDGGGGLGAKKPSDDSKLRFNRSETHHKKATMPQSVCGMLGSAITTV